MTVLSWVSCVLRSVAVYFSFFTAAFGGRFFSSPLFFLPAKAGSYYIDFQLFAFMFCGGRLLLFLSCFHCFLWSPLAIIFFFLPPFFFPLSRNYLFDFQLFVFMFGVHRRLCFCSIFQRFIWSPLAIIFLFCPPFLPPHLRGILLIFRVDFCLFFVRFWAFFVHFWGCFSVLFVLVFGLVFRLFFCSFLGLFRGCFLPLPPRQNACIKRVCAFSPVHNFFCFFSFLLVILLQRSTVYFSQLSNFYEKFSNSQSKFHYLRGRNFYD